MRSSIILNAHNIQHTQLGMKMKITLALAAAMMTEQMAGRFARRCWKARKSPNEYDLERNPSLLMEEAASRCITPAQTDGARTYTQKYANKFIHSYPRVQEALRRSRIKYQYLSVLRLRRTWRVRTRRFQR